MERKVIVFGATGKTGAQIIQYLQASNLEVAVFVRAGSVDKLEGKNVEIVTGDVLNQEDVHAALKDADYTDVIISLGSKSLKNTGIRANGTQHVIQSLEANQKETRLHVVSAFGVGESAKQLKWLNKFFVKILLKGVMQDHELQEGLVKKSGFKYHIIRPVGLKDKAATGNVHSAEAGSPPKNTINRADVAKYLVDSMLANKEGVSNISEGV